MKYVFFIASMLFIVSCSSDKQYSEQWYLDNIAEAQKQSSICKKEAATLMATNNCRNSLRAIAIDRQAKRNASKTINKGGISNFGDLDM